MAFHFNKSKTWTTLDGGQVVYLVGQLSRDIPFLARTKSGFLTTPFLIDTDSGTSMTNNSNAFRLENGKLIPQQIPPPPAFVPTRMVKLPSIVVNEKDSVKYFPFVAFNDDALALHKGIQKGDTVIMVGMKKTVNIPAVGQRDLILVDDVRLIRQSNRRVQAEADGEF